jgi:hypothetical protein
LLAEFFSKNNKKAKRLVLSIKSKPEMQQYLKSATPHIIAILFLIIVSAIYTSPVLEGKKMIQHDAIQAQAGAHENVKYHEETGIWSGWINSMFGGMPAYMIAADYPTSLSTKVGQFITSILPSPTNVIALQMICMYILLIVMGCGSWLSAIGGIAYGFGCYSLIFIEAGHISKILATAFAPLVLAGVVLTMRAKYWLGAALISVGMGLELYANHVQITYFLAMAIAIYVIWEGLSLVKEKKISQLIKATGFMIAAAAIGTLTHTTRLWSASEYAKESIRGKSELTISADTTKKITTPQDGLDRDAAFTYSSGVLESLTLLIPNFYGGTSQGGLTKTSETYKAMTDAGVDPTAAEDFVKKGAPVYWGPQPSGAAAYAGSIILFLFVFSFFVVKSDIKWYFLVISTLYMAFGWGKYFSSFNYLMFDYFPLFNKFRDNKMSMVLMEMFIATGAILALKHIIFEKPNFETIKKPLLISLGLTAGLALILGLGGSLFFDFKGSSDGYLEQMVGSKDLANAMEIGLKNDRAALLRNDGLRSALFILLTAVAIFMYLKGKLKANLTMGIIGFLVLADMFTYNKRYLNNDDFVSKSVAEEQFVASPADELILKDKDIHYRVADFASSYANSSYFHKTIWGYHGAKLKRIQELNDFQNPRANLETINMLNAKYILFPDSTGNVQVQANTEARGNAWFVRNFKIMADANAEIKALDRFDARETAFIDKRFESQLKGLNIVFDSTNSIKLTSYAPNKLTYASNTKTPQLAVFSEVFYRGNTDWLATIDGKPADHLRTDYVLRGMVIPAGNHKIEFVFDPPALKTGKKIDLIASLLMVLLIGAAFWMERKKNI